MPLRPNLIERQLIRRGTIPGIMLDVAMSSFMLQALIAAMELDVFDHLRDDPLDVAMLANRTDASEEGLEILLRTLVPLGYVKRDGDAYQLTAAASKSLPKEDLRGMATFLKEGTRICLDAAEAVREAPEDGIVGWERVRSGDVGRGYQATMRWLASGLVDGVSRRADFPDGAQRMLDVGGSHGLYTVAFCEKYPDLEGTILDWPIGLEAAQRTLDERPDLADRIDLVERDFEREVLPEGYDVAFLGNIIHGLSPDGNRTLFEKLEGGTTDRGMVVILDQVADPPSSSPFPFNPLESSFADAIAALIGFNLFLFSGGRSHAYNDVSTWLSESGFADISYKPLRESPGFGLVIARKTGAE